MDGMDVLLRQAGDDKLRSMARGMERIYKETTLFPEDEIHRQHQEKQANGMVHPETFLFEKQPRKSEKNQQGDDLLNDLELQQCVRSAIPAKAQLVGRHLKAVFKECQSPAQQNKREQSGLLKPAPFFDFKVAVPGQNHEYVADDQQQNGQ